jgi:hypothetical protein
VEGCHAKMACRPGRVHEARREWEGPPKVLRRGHREEQPMG